MTIGCSTEYLRFIVRLYALIIVVNISLEQTLVTLNVVLLIFSGPRVSQDLARAMLR